MIDLDAQPEQEQITHADDAALGLDIDDQNVAGIAESVALEPRRLRPRHAQHRGADGFDGHVGRVGHGIHSRSIVLASMGS